MKPTAALWVLCQRAAACCKHAVYCMFVPPNKTMNKYRFVNKYIFKHAFISHHYFVFMYYRSLTLG